MNIKEFEKEVSLANETDILVTVLICVQELNDRGINVVAAIPLRPKGAGYPCRSYLPKNPVKGRRVKHGD